MDPAIKELTNNGNNVEKLIGWTINFYSEQSVSVGSWGNVTTTIPKYVFVPGKIIHAAGGNGHYYVTWEYKGKTCGIQFESLDDIMDYKSADFVNLFLLQSGIIQDCYRWIYEGTQPVKELVNKAVDAGKAVVSGTAKTLTTGFDLIKIVGNALPVIAVGALAWWVFKPKPKRRYAG